jgi:hypothetical protein
LSGIAVSPEGALFFADYATRGIHKLAPGGLSRLVLGGEDLAPNVMIFFKGYHYFLDFRKKAILGCKGEAGQG